MDETTNDYVGSFSGIVGGEFNNIMLFVPVIFVLAGATLVFIYGLKKPEEPKINKKLYDSNTTSKKSNNSKKKNTTSGQTKQSNKTQNGSVVVNTVVNNKQKPIKSAAGSTSSSATPAPQLKKDNTKSNNIVQSTDKVKKVTPIQKSNKSQTTKSTKPNAELIKSKDKVKKTEKVPSSNDDGWQTVTSRTDKKLKKNENDLINNIQNSTTFVSDYLAKDIMALKNKLNSQTGKNNKNSSATGKDDKALKSKNQKQIKDEVNKSKKQADDAKNIKKTTPETDNNDANVNFFDNESSNNNSKTIDLNDNMKIPTHLTSEQLEQFVTKQMAESKAQNAAIVTENLVIHNQTEKIQDIIQDNNPVGLKSQTMGDHLTKEFVPTKYPYEFFDESTPPPTTKFSNANVNLKKSAESFISGEKNASQVAEVQPAGNVAFDELGDAWTEAKTLKKGKKRSRKE